MTMKAMMMIPPSPVASGTSTHPAHRKELAALAIFPVASGAVFGVDVVDVGDCGGVESVVVVVVVVAAAVAAAVVGVDIVVAVDVVVVGGDVDVVGGPKRVAVARRYLPPWSWEASRRQRRRLSTLKAHRTRMLSTALR